MGKSFKKHSFGGMTTCPSEKKDKRLTNRKLRKKVAEKIKRIQTFSNDPEDYYDLELDDVSNVWDFGKDGKMRVDPRDYESYEDYQKFMRK